MSAAGLVSSLLLFLRFLITDLDNTFGQCDALSCEDVSTKPIDDAVAPIAARLDIVAWAKRSSPRGARR